MAREKSAGVQARDKSSGDQETQRTGPRRELQQISDARTLRALAHPVRIAILETLAVRGPMTATQVGEQIGESATTCSFHLRQLAKYQFVEEAGGGKGRARPWRMSAIGMEISGDPDDPEFEMARNAVLRLARERQLDRYRAWVETKGTFPKRWRKAAGEGQFLFYLTAEELASLRDELADMLVARFRERRTDPARRPAGAAPVEMLLFAYPIDRPQRDG